ncbi:phage portal protein [Ornithinimicrobium sp. Arc0846-15]|nr:phage portal protein [Ornithinimicrobium laminariae]
MPRFQTLAELGAHVEKETSAGLHVADPGIPVSAWSDSTIDDVWASQPSVRKVLDFKARQIASTALHLYEHSDGGRVRQRSTAVAVCLSNPERSNASTPFSFWYSFVLDRLIYDRAAAMILDGPDGAPVLLRIPARRWRPIFDAYDRCVGVKVFDANGTAQKFPTDQFILIIGYSQNGGAGTPPVRTLRDLITEMSESVSYRRDMWKRGARVSGVVKRDKAWSSPEARSKFSEQWREFRQGGSRAGGTALLEDGMSYESLDQWSPKDVLDLEGRKLTDVEVSSFFHIAPELVGARQGNYSNMDAFRQGLYREALGPDYIQWEQAVNSGLAAYMGPDEYVEANIEGKLRGSFVEQAEVLSTSVGAPWMLRSEARDRMNMPPIDGDDELVVPLNVLVGGQASPRDGGTATSPKRARPLFKGRAPETHDAKHTEVLEKFFARQGRVVRSALGAGTEWWSKERWDKELADDLLRLHVQSATAAAKGALAAAGLDPDEYDEDRTVPFLLAAAKLSASGINNTTREQVVTALADDGEDVDVNPVEQVFVTARSHRAPEIAATAVTFASGFGVVETANQRGGGATKTWRTTSSNPRSSHARLNGQTVSLDEDFSNGLPWPGAAGSDADEVAGCKCAVEINYEES